MPLSDAANSLIRAVAEKNGVALSPDDPLLVVQTATVEIVRQALAESEQVFEKALAAHRAELERAGRRHESQAERARKVVVEALHSEAQAAVRLAMHKGVESLEPRLQRHERAVGQSALICALSCALSVAIALLMAVQVSR
jgi:hypothetical protein